MAATVHRARLRGALLRRARRIAGRAKRAAEAMALLAWSRDGRRVPRDPRLRDGTTATGVASRFHQGGRLKQRTPQGRVRDLCARGSCRGTAAAVIGRDARLTRLALADCV